jgi:hypothetical protein
MKVLASVCVASLLGLGAVTSASAASIVTNNPPNTSFTASGPTNLVKSPLSLACTSTFNGHTNPDGSADITSASFSGGPLGACSLITTTGLPWHVTAATTTQAVITGVTVNLPLGIGTCGPGTITANWTPHTLSFTGQVLPPTSGANCVASGNLSAPLIEVQ